MLKIIKQGSYINRVDRIGDDEAYSDASLLSTDYECAVHVRFRVKTYEILDATWGIHRAPDMSRRGQGIAYKLIGESGYIFDQKNSAAVLPDYSLGAEHDGDGVTAEWKIIRELFLEALRGAFQAEFFLFRERGYDSTEEFEGAWQDGRGAYCRPYTVAMPTPDQWVRSRDAKDHVRDTCIYSKYKNFMFLEGGRSAGEHESCRDDAAQKNAASDEENMIKQQATKNSVYAIGTYSDTLHEMSAELSFDRASGVISDFDLNVVRVPFPPCHDLDHAHAEDFVGKDIRAIKKREVGKILGGALGCFHFVDIVADIADMAKDIK